MSADQQELRERASLAEALDDLDEVLAKQGEERLNAIFDHDEPRAIVQALGRQEAFYTYAQLEEEGRQALLKLMSEEQLEYLLDLDLWEKDRLDTERVLEWFERLDGTDHDLVADWLTNASDELRTTALLQVCSVSEGPTSSDESLVEESDTLPPFTAEGVFYVNFNSERAATALKAPLLLLASRDMEQYLAMMKSLTVALRPTTEEKAYQQRWNRLRDDGFLPADEAYEIYRWPRADELELSGEGNEEPNDRKEDAPTALTLAQPQGLLATAVQGLDPESRRELSRSIAVTSVLVLAADHLHFADLDAHKRAVEKTLGYVNIGLHSLAEDNVEAARSTLRKATGRLLFRTGYAKVAALGRRATLLKHRGWLSQLGLGVEVLGHPLEELINHLARPRPLYPAHLFGTGKEPREFHDPDEIDSCALLLTRGEALGKLFIDTLGLDLASVASFDLEGCIPSNQTELTLGLIFRTATAQLLLDGQLRFAPVTADRLGPLAEKVEQLNSTTITAEIQKLLLQRVEEPTEHELDHLRTFMEDNIDRLLISLGGVDLTKPLDPRFVDSVVIRHA